MSKIPKLRYDTERINAEVPIAEVLERYMDVRIKSPKKKFLCPIHSERTPSAHIYTKANVFHCFGCGMTLTPLSVAKLAMPYKKFPSVCRTLLEDMGYDVRQYSNLDEVEAAKKQAWGKSKASEYQDYFPFTLQELHDVGIYKHIEFRDDTVKIAVIIPLNQIGEAVDVYNTYKLTGTAKPFTVNSDNAPLAILTMDADAVDVLKLKPYEYFSGEKEDIIQLWHKDKETAEKLIDNFCKATVSSQEELLRSTEELLDAATSEHKAKSAGWCLQQYLKHLRETSTLQEFNDMLKNKTKKERAAWDISAYITDLKDKITDIKGEIEYAQSIQQRLIAHQAEREKHTKREWKDFCTNS